MVDSAPAPYANPPAQPSDSPKPPNTEPAASSPPVAPGDSTKVEVITVHKAEYPIAASREKLQGEVVLKVTIFETGDVDRVDVVSGNPILAEAAVKAVRTWKFKPFIHGGKPIKVTTTIPIDFAFKENVTDAAPPAENAVDKDNENNKGPAITKLPEGVATGLLIHKVLPVYPVAARQHRIQGKVILGAQISKEGRIANLTVISGHKELVSAAIDAVQQWRYRPYTQAGQPVAVDTQIVVNFSLSSP
jgi:TonB family protein